MLFYYKLYLSVCFHTRGPLKPWCSVPSGGGEAGAGGRVRLPQREGEAGGPELHSHPESHPPLHLRGPGLEGLLLVDGAWRRQGRGELGGKV